MESTATIFLPFSRSWSVHKSAINFSISLHSRKRIGEEEEKLISSFHAKHSTQSLRRGDWIEDFPVGSLWAFNVDFLSVELVEWNDLYVSLHSTHDHHDFLWLLHNFLHDKTSANMKNWIVNADDDAVASRTNSCLLHFSFFVFIDSINHLINWLRETIMR